MKKMYNIVSLETGRIRTTVEADNYLEAVAKACDKLNCYVEDSYIVETAEETQKWRESLSRWWSLQNLSL